MATAALAGVDLVFDQQRADERDRRQPGDRDGGHGEAEAALPPGLRGGGRELFAAGGGHAPAARKKTAPSAAISQNQSNPAATAKASHRREQSRLCLPVPGLAARQAAKAIQSAMAIRPSTIRPPTTPSSANASR